MLMLAFMILMEEMLEIYLMEMLGSAGGTLPGMVEMIKVLSLLRVYT